MNLEGTFLYQGIFSAQYYGTIKQVSWLKPCTAIFNRKNCKHSVTFCQNIKKFNCWLWMYKKIEK